MGNVPDLFERTSRELDELFGPAGPTHGESLTEWLIEQLFEDENEDEESSAEIRERFEHGRSSGRFPVLSEFLSNLSDKEKETFFKTRGMNVLGRRSIVPEDVGLRFRQLQQLLIRQFEFETRYPEAFEILFPRRAQGTERVGLLLPSFGIRVLKIDPRAEVRSQDSRWEGDAYSLTHNHRVDQGSWRIERGLWPVHQGDLQGILLAILSREEYTERIQKFAWDSDLFDGTRIPEERPIRITDLRLAATLKPGVLKRGLRPVLERLQRPLTAERTAEWKLGMLGSRLEVLGIDWEQIAERLEEVPDEDLTEGYREYVKREAEEQASEEPKEPFEPVPAQTELLERQFGDETMGIVAVSFSAAALWLFLDLDMPGVSEATPYRLAEQIESLAGTIRKLSRSLNQATEELDDLTANRAAGRQPDIERKDHLALQYYRLGYGLRELAEWLGMTPYSSKTGRGTRDWKARVKRRLAKGKRIEDERYPRAAAIFANKDNPHVRRKARRAYRTYLVQTERMPGYYPLWEVGRKIRVNHQKQRGLEIIGAYVQLGYCLVRGRPTSP